MTEYRDLTFFTYSDSKWVFASGFPYIMLSVGWLGSTVPVADPLKPDAKKSLLYNLSLFIQHPVNLCRGIHICEICGCEPRLDSDKSWLGSGEIFIHGPNNLLYAAPTMIYHYVQEHDYVPPIDFIKSACHPPSMATYSQFAEAEAAYYKRG